MANSKPLPMTVPLCSTSGDNRWVAAVLDLPSGRFAAGGKQGEDVRQALAQTPKGFSEYVGKQLKQLAPLVKKEQAVRTLFAVVSVAKGALRESELEALTDLSAWDLADLPYQATRWWHIGEQDGDRTYAFTHPLLAAEIAKALGKEAEAAKQKLLAWCADWQTHKSPYALRHCADAPLTRARIRSTPTALPPTLQNTAPSA